MKKTNRGSKQPKERSSFIPKTAAAINGFTVECNDRFECLLGGCRKIEEYSEEETLIACASCKVLVRGKKLAISFLGEKKLLLSGTISAIEFIK